MNDAHAFDSADLGRLKWRCRRGLLENDLYLQRFFIRHGHHLDAADAQALAALMELADNDLMDLLMARREPEGGWVTPDVQRVLRWLREGPAAEPVPVGPDGQRLDAVAPS